MLVTLIIWILLFFIFSIYGFAICRWVCKSGNSLPDTPQWTDRVMVGMCFCTILALWFSMLLPLRLWPPLLVLAGAVILAFLLYFSGRLRLPEFSFPKINASILLPAAMQILFFVFILANAQAKPANPDTSLYHAQSIHWSEAYRVVPGLVHLHQRLAYNSSWLILNALFSFSFVHCVSYHALPGFLFFITVSSLMHSAGRMRLDAHRLSSLFALFIIPLLFIVSASEISSPGTDLPVLLLTAYLVNTFLRWNEARFGSRTDLFLITLLPVAGVTFKLSAFPLLLFPLLAWIKSPDDRRWLFKHAVWLVVLGWTPWMVRSVIMSGFLVYPFSFPDIFQFDWKDSADHVRRELITIRAWARNPGMNAADVMEMSFVSWVRIWFQKLTLNRRLLVAAAFVTPAAAGLAVAALSGLRPLLRKAGFWPALFAVYSGLLYWFFTAPDIRFGVVFLLPVISLGMAAGPVVLEKYFFRDTFISIMPFLLQGFVLLFVCLLFLHSLNPAEIKTRLLFPTDYPRLPSVPCQSGNFTVLCAQSYKECWYEPFPCIPQPVEGVYLRGSSYQDGFYSPGDRME